MAADDDLRGDVFSDTLNGGEGGGAGVHVEHRTPEQSVFFCFCFSHNAAVIQRALV